MLYKDGTSEKFQSKTWTKKLQNDKFRQRVLELMDDEIVKKYDQKMEKATMQKENKMSFCVLYIMMSGGVFCHSRLQFGKSGVVYPDKDRIY